MFRSSFDCGDDEAFVIFFMALSNGKHGGDIKHKSSHKFINNKLEHCRIQWNDANKTAATTMMSTTTTTVSGIM
jgi:hypothetical protein